MYLTDSLCINDRHVFIYLFIYLKKRERKRETNHIVLSQAAMHKRISEAVILNKCLIFFKMCEEKLNVFVLLKLFRISILEIKKTLSAF